MLKYFKNKSKRRYYCYLEDLKIVVLYQKDYSILRNSFPLHSIEISGPFAIIRLKCPYNRLDSSISFFHFGKEMRINNLKKELHCNEYQLQIEGKEAQQTMVRIEELDPCQMCKNQLKCFFSSTKEEFQPIDFDILYFIDTLKENRFEKSEEMYRLFCTYYDEDYEYEEMELNTTLDFIIVCILLIPILVVYVPFAVCRIGCALMNSSLKNPQK